MSHLTLLNLSDQPRMRADFESNAPTGVPISDITQMEQFLIGLKTHSGQIVTPEKAARCSAVLACLRILSEDISSLRLPLYKHTQNGPVEVQDHPLHRLINIAPNDIMTGMELREHIIYDLCLNGQFFILKNGETEIESLWPLQGAYVTRRWRELVWVFTDALTGVSGDFTPEVVWRGTIMSGNALDGRAITLLAREAIGLLLAAEEQGARLFAHGVQSDLVLTAQDELDNAARSQLRESFERKYAGSRNSWLPLLLQNGMDAKRIGLTAQESQYIEARNYQLGDICRVFRIPEVLMGAGTSGKSSTYASAESFFESYTKHTLTPWAVRIEQTMHRDLLTKKEQSKLFFKHDFTSLLRADIAGRYSSYETAIASGFMQPSEARRLENMPYVAGLDYFVDLRSDTTPPALNDEAADQTKPTDQSATLPRSVPALAAYILRKEQKALQLQKQDTETFYAHFAGFIEDITGADLDSVCAYIEMRRATADRFSKESQDKATEVLMSLCSEGITR